MLKLHFLINLNSTNKNSRNVALKSLLELLLLIYIFDLRQFENTKIKTRSFKTISTPIIFFKENYAIVELFKLLF